MATLRTDGPRFALLQELISGNGYGLDLEQRVESTTRGQITLNAGSLYPTLRNMEREGLVESYEGEPLAVRGGRPRVYYKITAEGRRLARDRISTPPNARRQPWDASRFRSVWLVVLLLLILASLVVEALENSGWTVTGWVLTATFGWSFMGLSPPLLAYKKDGSGTVEKGSDP